MRPTPQETADLVTFTEHILNGKLHLLCSESFVNPIMPSVNKFVVIGDYRVNICQ